MIQLKNQHIQIILNPECGGAVQQFTFDGQNVLRPNVKNTFTPQTQALFLMLPYCSFIKDGHFNYFGINRCVPPNQPNALSPLHGDMWLDKCQIEYQSETQTMLNYHHTKANGFPFDYNAKVTYTLKENSLDITLSIYNPSELPMPCGMGIHPYFIHKKTAQIQFASTHIWHHQQDPIFDRPYPTPDQWNFDKGRRLTEDFDTAFGGWDGHALITYPDEKLQVKISAPDIFHHIILYAPKGADFFCLEPVSNTPDAFNLAAYGVIGTGIQSIGAKQSLTKTITLSCQHI